MCGIAALLRRASTPLATETIVRMTDLVAHRGPDGAGVTWLGGEGDDLREVSGAARDSFRIALGHRRLSILDLSEAGRQPMRRGHLWITYNGEIYNYLELRSELERSGHAFVSGSDTEVILAAYQEWGEACFPRFRGMWGMVIVDTRARRVVLSRDRLGIKPLYLWHGDGVVAVASEIKQLTAVEGFRAVPNAQALQDYLDVGHEDGSRTFFAGVVALDPGTFASLDLDRPDAVTTVPYWFPERVRPQIRDAAEAARSFAEVLRESVRLHLRSDVPVGCALSGGLDSSAIAALVGDLGDGTAAPLHTFTATFPGEPTDERAWVDRVVAHVGTTAHFVTPSPERMLDELDRFVWMHDEPVGSASQYAGYCIARLTRQERVPVTLNGQGGDEVLAGYWQSYFMHLRDLARRRRPLRLMRHLAGAIGPGGNPELPKQLPFVVRRYLDRRGATKVRRVMALSEAERRVYEIRELYLPRLLKWDDRNFMSFSIEGRYPFLDHVVIEKALSFHPDALYARGWTKEPLRRGLAHLLPAEIVRRRTKFGFETPQGRWLEAALRPAIESWLTSDSPLWPHVDREETRKLATTVWAGKSRGEEAQQSLFRRFLADRWLRVFFS